jgi:penicillin-binding protein 1B
VAIKIKIPKNGSKQQNGGKKKPVPRLVSHPLFKLAFVALVVFTLIGVGIFSYYYVTYDRIVDARISGPIFSTSAKIYARPPLVSVGDHETSDEIVSELRRSGYTENDSKIGTYHPVSDGVEIKPGPQSYHNSDGATIRFADGKVGSIKGIGSGETLSAYELEPPLLTSLDSGTDERAKRQLVKYNEIPKQMVQAVTSIEDRRFFEHNGVNFVRLFGAALADMRTGRKSQGGSTITMQISRGLLLSPARTYKRKLREILIAYLLEQKLTKQQIFELYANQVYMGQRGSFSIHGFAEASRAYFNKDLQSLSLPETALIAGLIQGPNLLSPYKYPERALERRNLVLEAMVDTSDITREEADKAKATPLKLAPLNVEASDAPYFVDLVKDTLANRYGEREMNDQALRIYTTLDPDLQRAAAEAVQIGIRNVDEQIEKLRTHKVKTGTGKNAKTETEIRPGPQAQVAVVVLDPHTGEVLALVGGRNYGQSQLDHATANRPTGSIFKPFVYATAVNTALAGSPTVLTPATMVDDSPTTFVYGDQTYEPRNYKQEYHGEVTAEYALAYSLNNATVKLAEMVGYDNVAALARASGITSVKATPAMALGAYDASPMEMAGAYTVFANNGVRISPIMLKAVHNPQGGVVESFSTDKTSVLDPRVAYVMTSMMEGVMNWGYGYAVRQRGFTAPAAGKTGTSHDGWFAAYTSNLLCIVWVGFDDYSDLKLSGANTAAPIWAEFMKRAEKVPAYSKMEEFKQPDGVIDVRLDKATNRLSTESCPDAYAVAFIAGTEPTDTCDQADHKGIFQRIFGSLSTSNPTQAPPPGTNRPGVPVAVQPTPPIVDANGQAQNNPPDDQKKKKGLFGKIVGVFKGDDNNKSQ